MFGAPKKCAKCDKQVYSIEELKCLDKVWHKGCFKCTVCNSTLSLKNYKGMDKLPYCAVHYPKQTHTVVNDNPELLRIKENTKIQSQAKYHADYERSKGNFTVVADDPEMRRVLENTKNISNIKYHEDFERSRAKYTPINKINNVANNSTTSQSKPTLIASYRSAENQLIEPNVKSQARRIGSIADYDPFAPENLNESENTSFSKQYQAMQQQLNQQKQLLADQQRTQTPQKINNENQMNNNDTKNVIITHQNLNSNKHISTSSGNNSTKNHNIIEHEKSQTVPNMVSNGSNDNNLKNNSFNLYYDSNDLGNNGHGNYQSIQTSVYRAIYDYDANEDDEISFRDGDKFINCEQIDVGWMIGVHEKTGKHGMIPFNYAEPIDFF